MSDTFDHAGDAYYSDLERYGESREVGELEEFKPKLKEMECYNNPGIPVDTHDIKFLRPVNRIRLG